MAAAATVALALVLAAAPTALAGSLPQVDSGQLPGPPLLYDDPPNVPLLRNSEPFSADPLLVSGTDGYRDGEYLYQDYLFDDRGPSTAPGLGPRGAQDGQTFSPTAGDAFYPDDDDYANNAADLVEFRVTREDDALVYRITLNTAKTDDAAIVGIGVDTDDEQEPLVEWPDNAGMESPGLDHFVTAWGDGARVTRFDTGGPPETTTLDGDDVDMDTDRNQMTVRVPDDVVDTPGADDEWAYVAGTGVHDGSGEFDQILPGPERSEQSPTSGGAPAGSNVFNLAFRFFEPQGDVPSDPAYDTQPGTGNWFEEEQARKLEDGTTERVPPGPAALTAQSGDDERDFAAVVDFGEIDGDEDLHVPPGCEDDGNGCEQARIMPSRVQEDEQFEGVDYESFPHYGGPLQPYLLTVPSGYEDGEEAGLTFSLHSLGGGYTQFKVFSPQQLTEFGDERGDFVVTPLGHGPDGWYADEAEADFFSAWADVARHFDLDPDEVSISGYSMGGHGTYKLAVEYPDLFGRAFTTVGPPARGSWEPPPQEQGRYPRPSSDENAEPSQDTNTHTRVENLRWIPFMNWIAQQDQLVPFVGPRRQQARFDAEGLRSTLWTFQGDHFTLALIDQWEEAREFLQDGNVARDPGRVNFAFLPAADRPELDLVKDHAYWVSQLRVRDGGPGAGQQFALGCPGTGDQKTCPARGEIDARSLAFGEGDPDVRRLEPDTQNASPGPATVEGTDWGDTDRGSKGNALHLEMDNVGEAVIDGRRARLDGDEKLRVRVKSDGPGLVRLDLALPGDAEARRVGEDGRAAEVDLDSDGATFGVVEGERVYEIGRFGGGRGGGSGGGSGNGGSNGGGGSESGSDAAAPPVVPVLPAAVASVECAAYPNNFGFADPAALRRCVFAAVAVMTSAATPEVACAQQRMRTRPRRGRRFSDAEACRLAAASARTKAPVFGL